MILVGCASVASVASSSALSVSLLRGRYRVAKCNGVRPSLERTLGSASECVRRMTMDFCPSGAATS